ncbi:hypothetical protein E4U53_004311, partial [Claviceps sorghi]
MSSSPPTQPDAGTSRYPPVSSWFRLGRTYLPLLARVSLSHSLNLSETSPYHSLRSALTVAVIRAYLAPKDDEPRQFSRIQARTLSGMPTRGRIWISEYTSPAPPEPESESVKAALRTAIEALNNPDVPAPLVQMPDVAPVHGEWTGYRARAGADADADADADAGAGAGAGAAADEPQPGVMSARDKYNRLVAETKAPTTILYFHGGAHALMDPSTHRPTVRKLAKLTGGRAFSVRYRLAPQNAFPASLLDCLVAYMTLLYPPPGSFHDAVKPEHIVIAGD